MKCASAACALLSLCCAWSQSNERVQPGTLQSQDQNESERSISASRTTTSTLPPMTRAEKFRYHLRHSLDAGEAFRATAGSALDQWQDHPPEWGQGWDAYGVRLASHFGQHFVKEQIMFGVQVFDHEDPRHVRTQQTTFIGRALDAAKNTFIARSDSGALMPAYSRFIGVYGAAFISRQWYPERLHTVGEGFRAGSVALSVDTGMNVVKEFLPDVKKLFRR